MKHRKKIIPMISIIMMIVLAIGACVHGSPEGTQENTGNSEMIETPGTETGTDAGTETETATETGTETETESETESDTGNGAEDFSMFFTGDIMIKDPALNVYEEKGILGLISPFLLNEMVTAQMTVVNEEFPFSTGGTPMPNKQYTFRVNPKYVTVFEELGADVISLANNHSLDFGAEALLDTFATLEQAGLSYAGAGTDRERAEEAVIVEANGRKVGVLCASRVIPVVEWNIENAQPGLFCTYSSNRLVKRIKELEQECDFVVVYVHWGKERVENPEEYQRTLAKQYIDAGADLVVGSHPHVPQGIEYYNGVPIVYSLGNFMFNKNMVDTYGLKVVFDAEGNTKVQVIPVGTSNYVTKELTGEKRTEFLRYLESISFEVEIDDDGMVQVP